MANQLRQPTPGVRLAYQALLTRRRCEASFGRSEYGLAMMLYVQFVNGI